MRGANSHRRAAHSAVVARAVVRDARSDRRIDALRTTRGSMRSGDADARKDVPLRAVMLDYARLRFRLPRFFPPCMYIALRRCMTKAQQPILASCLLLLALGACSSPPKGDHEPGSGDGSAASTGNGASANGSNAGAGTSAAGTSDANDKGTGDGSTDGKVTGGNTASGGEPLDSLDTPCDGAGGPTGRALLATLGSERTSTLTPFDGAGPTGPGGPVTRPHDPTALTIGIKYGGAVTCFPAHYSCVCDPGPNGCPPCTSASPTAHLVPAAVSVAVALSFATADGSYDETFKSSVSSADFGFSGTVPGTAFRGTYPISLGSRAEVTMSFSGSFHDAGTHGGVSEETNTESFGAATW
jgi:hypothetical protein